MDPLKTGPKNSQELFERFSKTAKDFPCDVVVGAASNLLLNALRQSHARRDKAGAAFDELAGRLKKVLMEHYNGQGDRRNVFPFHQNIQMPRLVVKATRDGNILVPAED